jgi:hypothetical protein
MAAQRRSAPFQGATMSNLWGACGRRLKSARPDQTKILHFQTLFSSATRQAILAVRPSQERRDIVERYVRDQPPAELPCEIARILFVVHPTERRERAFGRQPFLGG